MTNHSSVGITNTAPVPVTDPIFRQALPGDFVGPEASICLNMIVKNEKDVIERCLLSVVNHIDNYVIHDTGSTDGTQDIIRDFMEAHGVPGMVVETPWQDFSTNRNKALEDATAGLIGPGDYVLFIDADEQLVVPGGHMLAEVLEAYNAANENGWPYQGYTFTCQSGAYHYQRNALVRADAGFYWEGVLHEYLTSRGPHVWGQLPVNIVVSYDGARSKNPKKYYEDAKILERALEEDPENTRNVFYLAQSYRDAGMTSDAIAAYQKRVLMGGNWHEEIWYSLYQIALLWWRSGSSHDTIVTAFERAVRYRPIRAEASCSFAEYLRSKGHYTDAVLYANLASRLDIPADRLFVDQAAYRWRALDELAISAYYTDLKSIGKSAMGELLRRGGWPMSETERIQKNAGFYGIEFTANNENEL